MSNSETNIQECPVHNKSRGPLQSLPNKIQLPPKSITWAMASFTCSTQQNNANIRQQKLALVSGNSWNPGLPVRPSFWQLLPSTNLADCSQSCRRQQLPPWRRHWQSCEFQRLPVAICCLLEFTPLFVTLSEVRTPAPWLSNLFTPQTLNPGARFLRRPFNILTNYSGLWIQPLRG